MFTSNNTPYHEFRLARQLGAIINLDDITHISALERATGSLPELLSFRLNPGAERVGNSIIGNPEDAKYGLTRRQIFQAYKIAKAVGVKRFGLHTMVCSNERNPEYFLETTRMMLKLAQDLQREVGIEFEFVNLGGGIGTPYRPEHRGVDLQKLGIDIDGVYEELGGKNKNPKRVFTECGRAVTGPNGWLLTSVRHVMRKYKDFVGVDATMADLMRPGMYGAYHHITVLGKESVEDTVMTDVVGSLCENNDKFAVNRHLPRVKEGDLLAIHNSGAHGRAMGFNYNGKLRSGEVLVEANGGVSKIRRHETLQDHFATLDFGEYASLTRG